MVEKKNVSSVDEENGKNSKTKKVTTGAWWKSTVATEPVKPKTKSSSSKSRARKPRKPVKPAPEKIAQEDEAVQSTPSAASTVKTAKKTGRRKSPVKSLEKNLEKNISDKDVTQKTIAAVTGDVASQERGPSKPESEVDKQQVETSTQPQKTPRKKRAPRGRKPAQKTENQVSKDAAAAVESEKNERSEADPTSLKNVDETISPSKTPRKRGRRKKSAPKTEEQLDVSLLEDGSQIVAELNVDGLGEQSNDIPSDGQSPDSDKEKKTPRRKPGRKRKPSAASKKATGEQVESDVDKQSLKPSDQTAVEDGDGSLPDEEKAESSTAAVQETASDEQVSKSTPAGQVKKETKPEHKPVIKLLINAEEPEECRLALLEDGRLESIHVATSTRTQTKNNIYKARIVAIEPNLQAAFVEYGTEKNGFLPFSEIHPEYYKEDVSEKVQKFIDQHQWKKLSITDVIERGREVLVQVVKEEVGTKGANMTTYLSLPGRCVVLMPGSDSTGISRKISGEEQRSQLRDYLLSMAIPEGIGWIVRTASIDITKAALSRDVNYLLKLWEDVKKKGQDLNGVGLIYQDHDHVLRFLREHFDPDIQEILVDSQEALEQVASFIELLPAKQQKVKCKLHRGARPIFNQYSIEDQIESIYQPRVNLPSGGSIVIDPTEALVAIDVNSGSTQKGQNFEDTIFQANMEAGKELARQLRLRDLGGLIVIDFIDMRSKRNIREVERQVKAAMKRDKAKVDISRISKFGLMQISRQKLGAPIEAGNYRVCEHCKGRGIVRSVETLALYYLRRIHTGASRKMVMQIECHFPLDVAGYLLNNKRHEIRELETKYNTEVIIIADPALKPADHEILFHKSEKDETDKKRS